MPRRYESPTGAVPPSFPSRLGTALVAALRHSRERAPGAAVLETRDHAGNFVRSGSPRVSADFPRKDLVCLVAATSMSTRLIVLDQEGCGQDEVERPVLESDIERRLSGVGWDDRAAAIVIAPELENWFWSDSPHVDRVLGWEGRTVPLRSWLREEGLLQADSTKPAAPKRAVELVLRTVRTPRSSAIYLDLAQSVSTERCTDPAFLKLRRCLREWFMEPPAAS